MKKVSIKKYGKNFLKQVDRQNRKNEREKRNGKQSHFSFS